MTTDQIPYGPAAMPAEVCAELQMTQYCRACSKFAALGHAASALADGDDLPASVFFKVNTLLEPHRLAHLQRVHPNLFAYEQQMEAARQAVLGLPT